MRKQIEDEVLAMNSNATSCAVRAADNNQSKCSIGRGVDERPTSAPQQLSSPSDNPEPRAIVVPGLSRKITVQIASKPADLEAAFHLLAENYQARGYETPSNKLYRFTPFHVLPDTIVIVAKHEDEVVATMSLVPDTSLLGLPMESIYGEEIAAMRLQGRCMGETTSLADKNLSSREFLQIFKTLIKLCMQYHLRQGGDTWVITVNPRHRNFYLKVLGFAPLGPRRPYPCVKDNPAEAYLLDLNLMKANAPEMYQTVFGEQLPDSILAPSTWSPDLAAYFGSQSTQVDRRTIRDICLWVEHFGSPPRWREAEDLPGRFRCLDRVSRPTVGAISCGC
jgi:N-acyl amino acid synthase FeeM